MGYGEFFDNGKGYRINTVKTPVAWKNILFNDEYFMEVSQRLCGQSNTVENYNRTPVFKEEKLFFAKVGEKVYQLGNGKGNSFACEHYIHKTVLSEDFDEFSSKITVCVPNEGQREMWNIEISNKTENELSIDVFACFEFENVLYMILNCDADKGYFVKKIFPYHIFYDEYEKAKNDQTNVYAMSDKPLTSYECSKLRFFGSDAPLELPDMIKNGYGTGIKALHEDSVAAFHNTLCIGANAKDSITYILGSEKNEEEIEKMYKNMPVFSDEVKKSEEKWNSILKSELANTDNNEFNYLANYWLQKQVVYLARHNRGGVYCPIRNQLQDAMGYAVVDPEEAFKLSLDVLRTQNENGHIKQWRMTDGSAERGLCFLKHSDACVWLIICMIEMINMTGKTEYFRLKQPYCDSTNEETILEHLKKAAFYMSAQTGEHGLCLMQDGDWTDPINGAGRKGKGESTWNTIALVYAIKQLLKIEYNEELDKIKDNFIEAINTHCWDEDRYIAGISDDGIPFGAKNDKQASLFLNAQTWAVFAEICTGDRLEKVKASIETLKTDFGYRLLNPSFTEWDPIWGKISVKQAGTYENGSVYVHANMFKAYADFYVGDYEKGLETVLAAMPTNPKNPTEINKQLPLFLPNYYYAEKCPNYGKSSNIYNTGAAPWVLWLSYKYLKK